MNGQVMSKQAWVWILLLAGGGVALYANWESISEELGLRELSPSHARAIRLAKDGYNLDNYQTNSEVIENRLATSIGEIQRGVWEAEPKDSDTYLVRYVFREDGKKLGFFFSVDMRTREVVELKRLDAYSDVAPGIPR